MMRPSGSRAGMSFIECTARWMLAGEQRLLDLLGEQPLAADLGQRPVADAVAGGGDHHDLDVRRRPSPWAAIRRLARFVGLGEGEGRTTGSNLQLRHLQVCSVQMLERTPS